MSEPAAIRLAPCFSSNGVRGEISPATNPSVLQWRFDRPYEPPATDTKHEGVVEAAGDDKPGESKASADDAPSDPVVPASESPPAKEKSPPAKEEAPPADLETPPAKEAPPAEEESPPVKVHGFEVLCGVEGLAVRDGCLAGTAGSNPVLLFERVPDEHDDVVHSIELCMRVSAGKEVGLMVRDEEKVDRKELRKETEKMLGWPLHATLEPGEGWVTYQIPPEGFRSIELSKVRQLIVKPTDAAGATFEIESIRFITQREHFASLPANIDWRGLSEIYRETLMLHASETVCIKVSLPSHPWLDLAVGTIENHPVTFRLDVIREFADSAFDTVLRRTVTTANRWEETPVDLQPFAGEEVELVFSLKAESADRTGFFGGMTVRNRNALPSNAHPPANVPRVVILMLADTLRRDHLESYGYARPTAPRLTELGREGVLFKDTIAQGAWTKVSVPSILSSLYPTTNGIATMRDRLAQRVTTLAEAFQAAGYATFSTSSVAFTGRMSNLQQGIDVLHERASVGELNHSSSKTTRTFVDRLLPWMEAHRDLPMFVFLHVFDPHSPFEPYEPYDRLWSSATSKKEHEDDVKKVEEFLKKQDKEPTNMPRRSELEGAGVAADAFVARERNWYDESIRAMDTEVGRVMERLEALGLEDQTLIAFVSDHGEEFLEHGRHFHGNSTYGEMTNVPLMLWGPQWIPAGTVVSETVQSLDLMPTMLELCSLPIPEEAQGTSLVPLVRGSGEWTARPAFSERRFSGFDKPEPDDIESFSMVEGGFRLVHNVTRPDGHPEYELYDHVQDPLNLENVADKMPERVKAMARVLAGWVEWASSKRIGDETTAEEALSPEEREALEALGYTDDSRP